MSNEGSSQRQSPRDSREPRFQQFHPPPRPRDHLSSRKFDQYDPTAPSSGSGTGSGSSRDREASSRGEASTSRSGFSTSMVSHGSSRLESSNSSWGNQRRSSGGMNEYGRNLSRGGWDLNPGPPYSMEGPSSKSRETDPRSYKRDYYPSSSSSSNNNNNNKQQQLLPPAHPPPESLPTRAHPASAKMQLQHGGHQQRGDVSPPIEDDHRRPYSSPAQTPWESGSFTQAAREIPSPKDPKRPRYRSPSPNLNLKSTSLRNLLTEDKAPLPESDRSGAPRPTPLPLQKRHSSPLPRISSQTVTPTQPQPQPQVDIVLPSLAEAFPEPQEGPPSRSARKEEPQSAWFALGPTSPRSTAHWSRERAEAYELGYQDALRSIQEGVVGIGGEQYSRPMLVQRGTLEPPRNRYGYRPEVYPPPQHPYDRQMTHGPGHRNISPWQRHYGSPPRQIFPSPITPSDPSGSSRGGPSTEYREREYRSVRIHGNRIHSRQLISCYPCRQRKLKCDGNMPCSQCARRLKPEECKYASSIRRRGKGKKTVKSEEESRSGSSMERESIGEISPARRDTGRGSGSGSGGGRQHLREDGGG